MIRRITFMMLALILITVGCSSNSSNNAQDNNELETDDQNEVIKLKLATFFTDEALSWTEFGGPWIERVNELTDGKVQFEIYPSEQLGKAADLLRLTKDGVADLTIAPANYYPDNMPLSNMLAGLPDLSENSQQGTLAYRDVLFGDDSTLLETDYLKNGVNPIATFVTPTYELWTTGKELRVPEDLKGLKIRTPGGIANKVYDYIGAVPVAISHPETFEALEKGVIDGASYFVEATHTAGVNELLEYAVYPHIGSVIFMLNINQSSWDRLPEDIQSAMIQAGEEVMETVGPGYVENDKQLQQEFIDGGGNIAELTEDEKRKWKQVTDEFTKIWLEENQSSNFPYKKILNMYNDYLEQHR